MTAIEANVSLASSANLSSINGSALNTTDPPQLPEWSFMPVSSLTTFILAVAGNSLLLVLFAKHRSLWTPFNVYLANLLIANLFLVLLQYPFDIVSNLYNQAWPMGNGACTVYLYAVYVLQAATGNAHQLIAFNRIWAVVHPMSYRHRHTFRLAISLCLGMWVFVHVTVVPGWLLDSILYRVLVPADGCSLNIKAQPIWAAFCQIFVFDWPVGAMVVALVVIIVAKMIAWRKKPRGNVVVPCSIDETGDSASRMRHVIGGMPQSRTAVSQTSRTTVKGSVRVIPKRLRRNRGNIVLFLLTTSFIITWTPIDAVFTMQLFVDGDWPVLYQVSTVIFSLQPVMDPILFTLALTSIREAMRRSCLGCGK